jgi:hypothetical protein
MTLFDTATLSGKGNNASTLATNRDCGGHGAGYFQCFGMGGRGRHSPGSNLSGYYTSRSSQPRSQSKKPNPGR